MTPAYLWYGGVGVANRRLEAIGLIGRMLRACMLAQDCPDLVIHQLARAMDNLHKVAREGPTIKQLLGFCP